MKLYRFRFEKVEKSTGAVHLGSLKESRTRDICVVQSGFRRDLQRCWTFLPCLGRIRRRISGLFLSIFWKLGGSALAPENTRSPSHRRTKFAILDMFQIWLFAPLLCDCGHLDANLDYAAAVLERCDVNSGGRLRGLISRSGSMCCSMSARLHARGSVSTFASSGGGADIE